MATEDDIKTMLDSIEDLNDNYKKLIKQQLTDIQNGIKSGKLTGDELKNKLIMAKAQIEGIKNFKEFNDTVKASTKTLGESAGEFSATLASAGTNVAKSFFGGGDALATTGALFNAGIDGMNVAAQAGSNSLVKLGQSMSATKPKLGMLMTAFGDATSLFSNAASAIAKEGMGLLLKETQKLINDFQTLSTVGAVYADGLTTLKDLTVKAYMTTDQFTKAVMTNKDNFTKAGIGVAEGSRRMAGAMQAGGAEMRDQLFNLGMSMNDQADAIATVIARMAGPMGKLISTDKEIADATADYAENLKIISDITGKTAKEQEAAAEARTASLKMQQEIAKMAPAARVGFQAAIGAMGEVDAKALQERFAFHGAVVDKDTALMETLAPALKELHQQEYQLAQQGKLNGKVDAELHEKYAKRINEQLASQEALGTAASVSGSSVAELGNKMGATMKEFAKYTDAHVVAKDAALKSAETNKKGVTAGKLMAATQDQQMAIQSLVNQHLGEFSKVLIETTNAITEMMNAIGHPESTMSKIGDMLPGLLAGTLPTIIGSVMGTGGLGTILGGGAEAAAGIGMAGLGTTVAALLSIPTAIAGVGQMVFGEQGLMHGGSGANFLSDAFEKHVLGWGEQGTNTATPASTAKPPAAKPSSPTAEKQQATTHLDKLSNNSTETNSLLRENNDLLRRLLQSNQQIHNAVS